MKRRLIRATFWFLLAGCLTTAPAFFSPSAHAQGNVESVTTYYNNSQHTTIVGSKIVFCDGQVSQSGTVTSFFTFRLFSCQIPQ
jgi:hypothetical protein